jgi:hypothetical protein
LALVLRVGRHTEETLPERFVYAVS